MGILFERPFYLTQVTTSCSFCPWSVTVKQSPSVDKL
ncbi:unnamed protein product [Psylliodes chrysocephalus]|uniref:Uncharacterized protein n=1 Tax=Psylliodes chrysocephalus TaxID=3402493 RepID=A0A9P0CHT4_9CUCU|nr:unnamed protein product [Psylliodes chrysocephala]